MSILEKKKQLKKELSLLHIYAMATGATIASGFFLLPGLAYSSAGPAMVLSYLIAVIPVIPALFSMSELSTAMPRAGGVYFFLDRSMGPLLGTIGGFGTWLALILKTAFALVGIGAYMGVFFPEISMTPFAIGFAIFFGIVNLLGAKKTGGFQLFLVFGILVLLIWFSVTGLFEIKTTHFVDIFETSYGSIISTTGLVYVSYVGLSKIASVSEEVKNPEKNIPIAMFMALGTAVLIYVVGTSVMIGVIPGSELANNLTPVATSANLLVGKWGAILMTLAAVLAFLSVANVGILSSSRYPLAMSRDHLMPPFFRKLTKNQIPINAILFTVAAIIFVLLAFDIQKIAKLAGAFQLILFALSSLAVIVMRESKIDSYDPGFKSPLYPWMQIIGIITPFWIIVEMGWLPSLFSVGLLVLGTAWYFYYARGKVIRDGAIYHIFARLGEQRFEGLDAELRGILKEKGLRDQDPFDAVIASSTIIDIKYKVEFDKIVEKVSEKFEKIVKTKAETLKKTFLDGTLVGATPVSNGAALPHLRLPEIKHSEIIMVRSKYGVVVNVDDNLPGKHIPADKINAFFFLISPEENPGQHLRILAQIASHVDDKRFIKRWLDAENEQDIKELMLRDDRFIRLLLRPSTKAEKLIGIPISKLSLPEGCLIALIHRSGEIIVPKGQIVLEVNDQLTIIGYPEGIQTLYEKFDVSA
ncbi:MAG: amino acid permease [Calditrichaeota bacterium]|nr:MAG: amino acid permease [Calditrichota bacterium]MBL1205463.1 amino acid permease [Calditrichota bacterium]NOG45292.1 amino acid permease [Calditrichota bacterium]